MRTSMKYALVIPDGAADEPQQDAGGLTPLQAARTPHMDTVVRQGLTGRAVHVPADLPSGSDVGLMSLLGYDPVRFHTGRAPIEAAAQGIELGDADWSIRCNLVTVIDGCMRSFTAGQIANDDARRLIGLLQEDLGSESPWKYFPGVSYRNLLVYRPHGETVAETGASRKSLFSDSTSSTAPHDILDQSTGHFLPSGPGSDDLRELMNRSEELFAMQAGDQDDGCGFATQTWLWGLGRRPRLTGFHERFGVRGAVVTAVDLARGIGRLIGWTIVDVDGATGYLDTDYAAKGQAAIQSLEDHDFVVVHVEATDEASHEGDVGAKLEALEQIDEKIVGPLHECLQGYGEYRLLISPDHPTLLRTRTHGHGTVPIAACGSGLNPDDKGHYDDVTAGTAPLVFERGYELMPWFLGTVGADEAG
ncbi:MAG: cofactor-independent phosphoglycerate mutase [Planctomycetaceae bacterium]